MPTQPELHVDVTAKVVKVTADVELHVDGRCVGTTTIDLTPELTPEGEQQYQTGLYDLHNCSALDDAKMRRAQERQSVLSIH